MENRGYFFIDGSRLFSSIHDIQCTKPEFKDAKLNISKFSMALKLKWSHYVGPIVRVIYYFKQNDHRIKTMLEIPEIDKPDAKNHWQIKECGESISAIPDEELQKISPKYRDHFTRSEKGLDIKLACDALLLVSSGRAGNLVFLLNDRDYIPLFESVLHSGGNVYLTALDSSQRIHKSLLNLTDLYLTFDSELKQIFGITSSSQQLEQAISEHK